MEVLDLTEADHPRMCAVKSNVSQQLVTARKETATTKTKKRTLTAAASVI
jgi:hypothetical protein